MIADGLWQDRRHRLPSPHQPRRRRDCLGSIVRERYCDFGPSLATEKLAEHHGCSVSRETLRGWMIAEGLWQDRRHRLPSPHQPRRRRDCLGELVQIDGSEHAWFEDRGPPCTLARTRPHSWWHLQSCVIAHKPTRRSREEAGISAIVLLGDVVYLGTPQTEESISRGP